MQKESSIRKNKITPKEFIASAGEMNIVGGKIKPNPAKGQIRFFINRDDILCFEWINLESKISNEPLAIFEEEWEWKKIETVKGRVYVLQNIAFPDTQNFFWLQYPNKGEDSLNESIISNILKTGKLEIEDSEQGDDVDMTVENLVKEEELSHSASTQVNTRQNKSGIGSSANNGDFIKNFTSALRNVEKCNYYDFIYILRS